MYDKLLRPRKPTFYIINITKSALDEVVGKIKNNGGNVLISILRGERSKTVQSFFNEASSALQFPDYFGKNWSAFDDCITDLEWLGLEKEAYILLIENANLLLESADIEDFDVLIDILDLANEEWKSRASFNSIPGVHLSKAFHVVFQVEQEGELSFTDKLCQTSKEFETLELE